MLIEINHLKVSLSGVPILHDVNLSLDEGEIYGLLGPNGAGKNTTKAAAVGLLKCDQGRIQILGKDPQNGSKLIHERLGVLPEQNGFYEWMNATDYLRFFAALYGLHPSGADLQDRLSCLGLEPRPRQRIETFSRGLRQRLGLARALIADPALLILNEPTNGLDPRDRRELHDILTDLSSNHPGRGLPRGGERRQPERRQPDGEPVRRLYGAAKAGRRIAARASDFNRYSPAFGRNNVVATEKARESALRKGGADSGSLKVIP